MKKIIFLLILFFSSVSLFAQEIDSSLAKNAKVILRVECSKDVDLCDKYCVQEVRVNKILKNETNYNISDTIRVSYYSWGKGVPKGISTIYIEKYGSDKSNLWKLIGGKSQTGVSHVTQVK